MMANNYESLKTDGHYTMARRIFQKVRSVFVRGLTAVPVTSNDEILSIGFMEIIGNGVGPWMVFTKGDNINITEGGLSGEYVISAKEKIMYGVCNTALDVAAKTVTINDFGALVTGKTIYVKFTNTNVKIPITLNVNGTGAKQVNRYGDMAVQGSTDYEWYEGAIVGFTYDGTYWVMHDWRKTEYYWVHQYNSTDNKDYRILLSNQDDDFDQVTVTNKSNKFIANPSTGNMTIGGNLTDKWGLQTSRSLFQSEFDNLTQSERDNGTTYYIKDGVPLRICDYIYPVGAIYMSVNNISPALLFGGTWEMIKDTFLLAAGDDYTAGSTGGEAEHTLSIDEMPTHRHTFKSSSYGWEGYAIYGMKDTSSGSNVGLSPYNKYELSENNVVMQNTGGGQPHNNMPPYLTVYMWKRVPDPEEQGE